MRDKLSSSVKTHFGSQMGQKRRARAVKFSLYAYCLNNHLTLPAIRKFDKSAPIGLVKLRQRKFISYQGVMGNSFGMCQQQPPHFVTELEDPRMENKLHAVSISIIYYEVVIVKHSFY